MNRHAIEEKAKYHAAHAAEAWTYRNLADYAIETARFELACKAGARMDRAAARLYDRIHGAQSWLTGGRP